MNTPGVVVARCVTASLFFGGLLLVALPAAARERVILQKSTTDPQKRAANTWIDKGATTTNHGTDTTITVSNNTNLQRGMVQFDMSAIPNSGIKLATLSLFLATAPTQTRTYSAGRITSLWTETGTTWISRALSAVWTALGADFAAATATATTGTTSGVTLNWTVTSDVQTFFGAAAPSTNFGWMITDGGTTSGGNPRIGMFSSNRDANALRHPSLAVEFIQNVQGLKATAGNAQVILNWTYPAQVAGSTIVSATKGVLILRQTSQILASAVPTDGTAFTRTAGCANTIGGATVVFNSTTLPTTFNDSATGDNPTCPPVNGTQYFYKVYVQDAALAYSANAATSNYVPETVARPSATPSSREITSWLAPTGGTALAAPGTVPGTVAVVGSNSNLLSGINPADGSPLFNPVSLGGAISGRPIVLDSLTSALARNVAYVAAGDGLVYAIDVSTGDTIWMVNPTGLTTNGFTAPTGVVVSSTAALLGSTYTRATDLVVVGTRNTASTTTNQIVGIDGSTGATVWQLIGSGTTTNAMDIAVSEPYMDYQNNAVWVATNSGGGTTRPSLWKLDMTAGTKLATANLGNISSSPLVTLSGDVLFVGNDAGTLFAINPATAATFKSAAGGDTRVVGTPLLLTNTSPYTVVFAGATKVQKVIYNLSANTFTTTGAGTWSTTMPGGCTPSSPVGFQGLPDIYVSCSDGNIYQLDDSTGAVTGTLAGPAGSAMGDPTLDLQLSLIMAGNVDGRVFTFPFPF
ncbi:MAG TPA: PQQ-binding-like beta-propeller repeat protein [Candidatus Acidoferrum sp.]|jgi:hypothetical protein